MNRRQFIRLTSVATLAISSGACATGSEYNAHSLAQPELLTTLGAGPVRAIGSRYREVTPSERDVDALRAAIVGSRPLRARFVPGSGPAVGTLVHDDFEHGRTVILDGWILSVTEARQCALFSLLGA